MLSSEYRLDLENEGNGCWWLDVIDKGNKSRRLPVPREMLDAFREYRQAFGLLPQSSRTDDTPLVLSCRSRGLARITDEATSEALKAVFGAAALAASADGDSDTAAVLRLASAYWLRHSMLTNRANIATTAACLHKTDNERHDEIISAVTGKGIL